jgi:hypothetical protein
MPAIADLTPNIMFSVLNGHNHNEPSRLQILEVFTDRNCS